MTTSGNQAEVKSVAPFLGDFNPISLEEMEDVELLDRFDKKFVFRFEYFEKALRRASVHYRVLQIGDHREFDYETLYYDTDVHRMYLDHHNRKLNRFKVRRREYLTTGIRFLEVKIKSNKGRTRKKRMETANAHKAFTHQEAKFIHKHTGLNPDELEPKLANKFRRITLVHRTEPERITIDYNLNFRANGRGFSLPDVVIAEIKQDRSSGLADMERIFRQLHILPMKFSKYCVGSAMLYKALKYNRFKTKLLTLNKMCNDSSLASVFVRS
ncbi:MAG: polyphosphate polymerase domain-containing protein [Bacteroidales bacterium]